MASHYTITTRQLSRVGASLPLLLVALLFAVAQQRTLAQHSAGAHLPPQHGHMDGIPTGQHFAAQQLPLAKADGIVTGAASAEAQADFVAAAAGSRRALLHGKRRPRDYSVCPRCTPVTCRTGTNACSGHCKSDRALFTCKTVNRVAPGCGEDLRLKPDPSTVPADALQGWRSVQVMAPAPYLGCANVTGAPDGCPPAGTTGTLAGHGGVTVLASTCMQHLYLLPCATGGGNRTPFHPFGYCQCLMKKAAGGVFRAPCRTTFINWSGSEGRVPVGVSTEGGLTFTQIGARDEADGIDWRLEHTFETQEGPIDIKMQLYDAFNLPGYDFSEEGPLSGEEGDEEEEEEESALGAFLRGFNSG